ncbi:NAD(+) diphosphatase [Galactobacter caseinivorans]|uniref:NAD(+) diphosphatase n=1 Tax=Galactobacter caseinivorans TaxID=2676123 RepID=A0A496PM61_9MICC|nr:NAD(+) diphosphatase [Galactobacter caseinivorans]RKW71621.1 NAD(+) diphosphatase [Galactobacter caseinivorans]
MTFVPQYSLAPLALTGGGVDRGGEDRRKQGWLDSALERGSTRLLAVVGGKTLVLDDALAAPELGAPGVRAGLAEATVLVWLGRVDGVDGAAGVDWVAAQFVQEPQWWARASAGGATPVGLRGAAELSRTDAALLTQAVAVLNWHSVTSFCSRCGAPNEVVDAGWVRRCTAQGTDHFPRTDPAVIVLVTDAHDRVLLGANAAWGGDRFSMLAGFVEPGESLEEAVIREVGEESGVSLDAPRYLGSQPWPLPASLMVAFHAMALSTHTVPDGQEIVATRWFTRDELASEVAAGSIGVPGGVSVAGAMLRAWFGGELPTPATSKEARK